MNRFSWRVAVGVLALIVFGFALGVGFTTWLGMRRVRAFINDPTSVRTMGDRGLGRIRNHLVDELGLTPEEKARVEAILDKSATTMRTMRRENMRAVRGEIHRAMREIADSLPPEKREKLQQQLAKRFQWFRNDAPPAEKSP